MTSLFPLQSPCLSRPRARPRILTAALAAALALAATGPGIAHPHVWIDMASKVTFDAQGAVTGIRIAWTFDDFYSVAALDGLDENKNGAFDAPELQKLAQTYNKNLKTYGFFTSIEAGGKRADVGDAANVKAWVQKGRLTFAFDLPLKTPVDPRKQKLSYSSFDPSFYIDIRPVKPVPVAFAGSAPKACGFKVREGGAAPPSTDALNITQSFGAPPTDGIFGALSVGIIDIECAGGAIP